MSQFFENYFADIYSRIQSLDSSILIEFSILLKKIKKSQKKIIIIGNGGSAGIASHAAVDLTKAAKIRAVNFNEAGLLTCYANDYGYENWAVEALKSYADKEDLVILISSSGKSPNILNAAEYAQKEALNIVTLSGFSEQNPLRRMGKINLWADSTSYNIVEITHYIWLLSVIDFIQTGE
jgi:D-sedoheptulose 7-phosphate isomerase